jgi:hypothetical protein
MAGKYETQGSCGELLFMRPDARRHEKSLEWAVKSYGLFVLAIA